MAQLHRAMGGSVRTSTGRVYRVKLSSPQRVTGTSDGPQRLPEGGIENSPGQAQRSPGTRQKMALSPVGALRSVIRCPALAAYLFLRLRWVTAISIVLIFCLTCALVSSYGVSFTALRVKTCALGAAVS